MMNLLTLKDLNLYRKRVLMRQDFNVPITQGRITSEARINAALPSIQYALSQEAALILLSHLGRPKEGVYTPEYSLAPIAVSLERHLGRPVRFVSHWIEGIPLKPNEIVLCENVRMQEGEKKNDPILAQKLAGLADIFAMDAFAASHRKEASTVGVTRYASQAVAGLLLQSELKQLSQVKKNPARPLVALVGGSKISTKLSLLASIIPWVDTLIVGGGVANTFIAAQNFCVGRSLFEPTCLKEAHALLQLAREKQCHLIFPQEVIVAHSLQGNSATKHIQDLEPKDIIFDISPANAQAYTSIFKTAGTILWNGPVGVFESPSFKQGTAIIAQAIAASSAFSVAGGGDTLAAIEQFNIASQISYTSTGGGAFLAFLEDKPLPAVQALLEHRPF